MTSASVPQPQSPNGRVSSSGPRPVSPDQLLSRAAQRNTYSTKVLNGRTTARAAKTALTELLRRMTSDSLTIVNVDGASEQFGPGQAKGTGAAIVATVNIRDERAWTAIAREGSIGLGRGYIEGWWHSDEPTDVVRILIRNLHGMDDFRNRLNQVTGRIGDTARRALPRSTRNRNREEISAHYDLGNDFFGMFLDETMTYSSGVFAEGFDDLKLASLSKYDRLLAKLGVDADHEILEIGTGWGGMALRLSLIHI